MHSQQRKKKKKDRNREGSMLESSRNSKQASVAGACEPRGWEVEFKRGGEADHAGLVSHGKRSGF